MQEIIATIRENKEVLKQRFKVKSIAIVGSIARGEDTIQSDIDVLVEFDENIGWDIVEFQEFLEGILGRKVDLLTKNAVRQKPELRKSMEHDAVYV